MKYYENRFGIFIGDTVPDDCRELTADEFNARLEEIRRNVAEFATELVTEVEEQENNDNRNL